MKNSLVVLSVIFTLALTAGFVYAGSNARLQVNVPFSFYAGEKQFEAGSYIVEMESGSLPDQENVTLRAPDGTRIFAVTAQPKPRENPSLNQLLFNRYGDQHFLSGVSILGLSAGVKMSSLEKNVKSRFERDQLSAHQNIYQRQTKAAILQP